MTTLTDTQVITASGGLVELGASTYTGGTLNISSSSAASPTNVISDTTVVCDGSPVEIEFFAPQVTTGASGNTYIALWKDGAEFVRYWGVMSSSSTTAPMRLMYRDTPTAGSHTYSVKGFYATAAGQVIANTGGTAQAPASLRVSKIVQATQWPAVTTGTIICTSSTRPASPFEGQTIYETDTKRQLVWNASAWVAPQVVTKPPMVKVVRSGDRTSYSGADIEWNNASAAYDTDSMWSSGSNTRLTFQTSGIYRVTLSAYITWTGTSTATDVKIMGNGSAVAGQHYITGSLTGGAVFSTTALVNSATYSYVTAQAGVIGGTSVIIKDYGATFFAAEWLGKA